MSRSEQAAQKTQRAVEDLDAYCRQLERLARRVSRIALRDDADESDIAAVAPLDPAIARLDNVVARIKEAAPEIPQDETTGATIAHLMSTDEGDPEAADKPENFAEALTEMAVNPDEEIEPKSEDLPGQCILRGMSPSLTVPTILEFLASQRKNGVLIVDTDAETFTIEISEGCVVHAVSTATPLQERLGSILLQRGRIGAEQLQTVLSDSRGGLLGAILLEDGIVERDDLIDALMHQASLLFRRLFENHRTEFRFYEGKSSGNDLGIDANVTMMLLEGARTKDESSVVPETDWNEWM